MADSIYRIPNLDDKPQQEHELEAFLESAQVESNADANAGYIDFLSSTEEMLVAPTMTREELPGYVELKALENDTEVMRRNTKPVDIARYELSRVWAPLADTFAPTTNADFEKRLINIEAEIGRKSMKLDKNSNVKSHRFWFDHDGHYFYEVIYKDQPNDPVVVHYHILPHVMTKTSNGGRVVAFDPGEAEALLAQAKRHHLDIRDKFYAHQSNYDLAA